jgi:hypothetical protein
MANWLELTPAYGRDYKSQKAVKEDWNADKDFVEAFSGSYINKSGAAAGGYSVTIRYAKLQKVLAIAHK